MINIGLRTITSLIGGVAFFGCYYYSSLLFSCILLFIAIYSIFFEWSKLIGGISTVKFWLLTPFYPLFPFLILTVLSLVFSDLNWWLPLYPYILAWVYDISAYMIGSVLGRHKIIPHISPEKSWEGVCAGFLGILITNYLIGPYVADYLPQTTVLLIIYTISVTVLAFFGDLFISYLKRQASLKDTGYILPGHGGLLDRFDSVLFVAVGIFFAIGLFKFVFLGYYW